MIIIIFWQKQSVLIDKIEMRYRRSGVCGGVPFLRKFGGARKITETMINFEKSECLERTDKKNEKEATGRHGYERRSFAGMRRRLCSSLLPFPHLASFIYSSCLTKRIWIR